VISSRVSSAQSSRTVASTLGVRSRVLDNGRTDVTVG
jgi:hypothetical protein